MMDDGEEGERMMMRNEEGVEAVADDYEGYIVAAQGEGTIMVVIITGAIPTLLAIIMLIQIIVIICIILFPVLLTWRLFTRKAATQNAFARITYPNSRGVLPDAQCLAPPCPRDGACLLKASLRPSKRVLPRLGLVQACREHSRGGIRLLHDLLQLLECRRCLSSGHARGFKYGVCTPLLCTTTML